MIDYNHLSQAFICYSWYALMAVIYFGSFLTGARRSLQWPQSVQLATLATMSL